MAGHNSCPEVHGTFHPSDIRARRPRAVLRIQPKQVGTRVLAGWSQNTGWRGLPGQVMIIQFCNSSMCRAPGGDLDAWTCPPVLFSYTPPFHCEWKIGGVWPSSCSPGKVLRSCGHHKSIPVLNMGACRKEWPPARQKSPKSVEQWCLFFLNGQSRHREVECFAKGHRATGGSNAESLLLLPPGTTISAEEGQESPAVSTGSFPLSASWPS